MEWLQNLEWGPEAVYALLAAVVSAVLTWIGKNLSTKRQLAEMKVERVRAEMELRREVLELREQLAATTKVLTTATKADATLKAAQAAKVREEVAKMQRQRRLREVGDMLGIPVRDDE